MRRWAFVCALLLCAGLAGAQAPTPAAVPLPPVEVPLPSDASASAPARRDSSATMSVVDATTRRGEAKNVAELIASTPGTVVQDAGGAGQRTTLSLRGASPNAVLVMLDGVPLTGPGLAVDLSRIPAAFVDRVEVLRGAAARYGPGGLGGAVDLISHPPEGTRVSAEVSQGSFLTTTAGVGGSLRVGPGEGLVLLHGLTSAGDFPVLFNQTPELDGSLPTATRRQNNAALQGGGLLRYRQALGGGTLDLIGQGFSDARGLAGTVQNPTVDAHQTSSSGVLSSRLALPLEGGGDVSLLAWGRGDVTTLVGAAFGSRPFRQLESGAGLEVSACRLLAQRHGVTALLTAGGDWLTVPSGQNPAQGRVGAMVGDELLLLDGRLTLSGSARLDVAGPFVVVSPKVGAAVQLPKGFEVRANGGQASRPPSFSELYVVQGTLLPNPELRPERALSADATLAWSHEGGALAITGFGALYQDLISYEYYPPMLARPYNFQAARVAGVEVEGRMKPARTVEATVAYTFLSTQNLRDDPRYYLKALPYRPQHRAHARVAAGVPMAMARAEVLVQSEQFQNRTETLSLPARAFVNVGFSSTPFSNHGVTVSLEVKNLLDAQSQDVDGYPLPPRAAYLTLAVAWDAAKPGKPSP